jgi:uncharacterized protein (TIGR02757 family)
VSYSAHAESRFAGITTLRATLEGLYGNYNRFEHIHPDPLEFVYCYQNEPDREIVGFLASALAYGRVAQILCSVRSVLDPMGASPSAFLSSNSPSRIAKTFKFFKHRFTTGEDLASLLTGIRKLLRKHDSLEKCFLADFDQKEHNILPALAVFVRKLEEAAGRKMPMFLPSPDGGSACKRLNLFLRWMVRRDNVDPGIWRSIPASHLIIPLDTHMHRIALRMGLTTRKQADMRCAVEVTGAFRSICPDDPVRYDFVLTRLGMNGSPQANEALDCLCTINS